MSGYPWWCSGLEYTWQCRGQGFDPQGDLACHRAAKPMCHNYWACTLEPENCGYWNPRALEPVKRDTAAIRRPCSATREWSLLTATREISCTAVTTQHRQKINRVISDKLTLARTLKKLTKYFSKKDLTLLLAHVAALEKEMATQSNILSWEISWTEEPGGLESIVSQNGTQLSN